MARRRRSSNLPTAETFIADLHANTLEAQKYPPTLRMRAFAELIGTNVNTLKDWVAQGRFEGATWKRGKNRVFMRDAALRAYFDHWRD